ncbi:MAG: hypothetical protein ACXQS5_03080 [Candidatus Methanospirareceae archaeon]
MKNKTLVKIAVILLVVLAIVIALIAYFAFLSNNKETAGLEIVDIKITDPKPSILNDRAITIDYGESVTLNVTLQNKGDNITCGEDYSVGIAVITNGGDEYWRLPQEQYIRVDLGPGGKSRHTFTATNKKDHPFRGKFELQGYIKSVETGEVIARSDIVTVEIRYPA